MSEPTDISSSPAADTGDASEGSRGKSSAQQRIDQLVRRSNDAERNSQRLAEENAALTAKLAQLSEQVAGSRAVKDTSSNVAHQSSPASSQELSIDEIVGRAVEGALGKIISANQAKDAERARLVAAQDQSFERAVATFPQLADPSSEERKLFNQLFDSRSEFNRSIDGPELAAEVVRGAISGARRATRATEQGKQQASVRKPGDLLGSISDGSGTRQEKAQSALEQLHQQLSNPAGANVDAMALGNYIRLAEMTRPDAD